MDPTGARKRLKRLIDGSGFSVRKGKPPGHTVDRDYICAWIDEQWEPIALILDNHENTAHCSVVLNEGKTDE